MAKCCSMWNKTALHMFNGNFSRLFLIVDNYPGSFNAVPWSDGASVPEVEPRGDCKRTALGGSPSSFPLFPFRV